MTCKDVARGHPWAIGLLDSVPTRNDVTQETGKGLWWPLHLQVPIVLSYPSLGELLVGSCFSWRDFSLEKKGAKEALHMSSASHPKTGPA